MFRKIITWMALVSALTASQLPLGIIQIAAWTSMFSDFVDQTGSVETSWALTFDGQHTCTACDFVSERVAETEEKEHSAVVSLSTGKLLLASFELDAFVVEDSTVIGETCHDLPLLVGGCLEPVTPPPRIS
ncbi:MAG: hypothetical protein CMI30_13325 [Opitutae bacterium]|nr:hypothetical protein [Opitutae bacterium]